MISYCEYMFISGDGCFAFSDQVHGNFVGLVCLESLLFEVDRLGLLAFSLQHMVQLVMYFLLSLFIPFQ